jgi:hypothetical protein
MRAFLQVKMSQKGKTSDSAKPAAAQQRPGTEFPWRAMGIILAVQALLLATAAKNNLDQLNNDAIAYLRLGEYYAQGKMELAISGYWGPMLSWLIALGIKLGFAPLTAGRAVMVLSALIFQAGCVTLLRAVNLPKWSAIGAALITALASIFWSAEYLSPDLLLTGILLATWGILFSDRWWQKPRWAVIAGVLWGIAYLTKAVAFPLALGTTVLWAGFKLALKADRKRLFQAAGITLAVFAVTALPWLITLSGKYGHFTFSTSGSINHSIVGPKDVDRYHPVFRTLHQPEAGRVTQWEEPSRMDYKPWSPFASGAYFQHQVQLVKRNFETIIGHLVNFGLFYLGFVGLLGAFYLKPPWREQLAADRWRWSVLPLLCLCGLYLPVWVAPFDERYFYAALPVQLICAFSLVELTRTQWREQAWIGWITGAMVLLSFGFIPAIKAMVATDTMRHEPTTMARGIADELKKQGLTGPIAGSGTVIGFRTGLFTAYFLDTPWLGGNEKAANSPVRGCECAICQSSTLREPETSADEFIKSGAKVLILSRESAAAADLFLRPEWRKIDISTPISPTSTATNVESPVIVLTRK